MGSSASRTDGTNCAVGFLRECGGRLILGLGAGFIEAEALALGTPFAPLPERLRMLEEHFAIVSHLTSEGRGPLSFDGRYARADGAMSHPHGVQRPHIRC